MAEHVVYLRRLAGKTFFVIVDYMNGRKCGSAQVEANSSNLSEIDRLSNVRFGEEAGKYVSQIRKRVS